MDRGALWATVYGFAELDTTEQLTLSFFHFMAYYRILNIVSGAIQ